MPQEPRKTIRIQITPELYEQIKCKAKRTGRTVPKYTLQVLKYHLRLIKTDPDAVAND